LRRFHLTRKTRGKGTEETRLIERDQKKRIGILNPLITLRGPYTKLRYPEVTHQKNCTD
jgi:hypothetical protein